MWKVYYDLFERYSPPTYLWQLQEGNGGEQLEYAMEEIA